MSYEQKAVVKLDSDGAVVKCAKGLAAGQCGFKAGSKVCGKCGAMAIQVKMVPVDDMEAEEPEDEMTDEAYQKMMRRRKAMAAAAPMEEEEDMEMEDDAAISAYMQPMSKGSAMGPMGKPLPPVMDEEDMGEEDEMMEEEEEMASPKGMRWGKKPMSMKEMEAAMGEEDEMMEEEEEMASPKGMRWGKKPMSMKEIEAAMAEDEEMMDGEEEDEEEDGEAYGDVMPMRKPMTQEAAPDLDAARLARLRKLGTKSADIGLDGYMCAIERKVYPGSVSVCDDCPGGCVAEKGLPGLLHVEGLAEAMFKGDVIDSGYSAEADMFVVDVQTKSGYVNEVFVDGTTAEVLGFHRLDDSIFEQKSLMDDIELINFNEAAEIAVKSVPGTVIAVEPGVFEGFDAYQVEVDGFDKKSYDVYVALDGEVLGWDKWEPDDVDDIEAEAAEISLKRAFSDESRQQMAESGEAMDDGSFPISSEADLRNAIMAHGRAKDIPAAKRHIMKRAAALSMEKLIPAEWTAGEKNLVTEDGNEADFLKSLVEFELLQTEVVDDK